MKNVLCSHYLNAAAVTALLFTAGCIGSGEQSGTEAENELSGANPAIVTSEQVKPTQQQNAEAILLNTRKDLLRLTIKPEGGNADESTLASDIVQRTQGTLASNDAKVITDGNCDVRVTVRPKLTIVDQDGGYYRMNSTVDVSMTSADGRIFGTNKIDVAASRRVLGKDAAISGLAEPAARKTADWCRKELNRIADTEVGVTVLSIQLPTIPGGEKRDAQADAANIKAIGDEIAKMPNLVAYELAGQDLQAGTCQYRVVYFISKYPNGIANEVSVLLNRIKQN